MSLTLRTSSTSQPQQYHQPSQPLPLPSLNDLEQLLPSGPFHPSAILQFLPEPPYDLVGIVKLLPAGPYDLSYIMQHPPDLPPNPATPLSLAQLRELVVRECIVQDAIARGAVSVSRRTREKAERRAAIRRRVRGCEKLRRREQELERFAREQEEERAMDRAREMMTPEDREAENTKCAALGLKRNWDVIDLTAKSQRRTKRDASWFKL